MRKLIFFCFAAVLAFSLATSRAYAATDVTGVWTGTLQRPDGGGAFDLTFTFKQNGSTLTGTVTGGQGEPLTINNGKIEGDKISFSLAFNGATITDEGTVNGDEIKLNSKSNDGSFPAMSLTLKRAKAALGQ